MSLLKYVIVALLLATVVAGVPVCPSKEFVEERMAATETVVESVKSVFSDTLSSSDVSLTSMEIYERVATSVDSPVSTEGFVDFQEAVSEIAAATHDACSAPEDSRVKAGDAPVLISAFNSYSEAEMVNEARQVYGKQLCLNDILTTKNVTRTPEEELAHTQLNGFFDSLDGEQAATLFGIESRLTEMNPPTLAFVVDDTGSMSGEIMSVQRLIRSFIRTERTNALAYILTTFNDPGRLMLPEQIKQYYLLIISLYGIL